MRGRTDSTGNIATRGIIFNIQRFSTHDGPGVRTVVFFKGCPLHCAWCHNPESIPFGPSLSYHPEHCIGCGRCVKVCPHGAHTLTPDGIHLFSREMCRNCLTCTDVCFAEALQPVGRDMSPEEILTAVQSDAPYYGETGGVTFSGGECLAQPDFLLECLILCRQNGFHTAVDTAASAPWSVFEQILPYTDLFLVDLKAMDAQTHQRWTGMENHRILQNLQQLQQSGVAIRVRVPFIPQANGEEMTGIALFLSELSIAEIDLLPYHRLGEAKRAAAGLADGAIPFEPPARETIEQTVAIFSAHGITAHTDL